MCLNSVLSSLVLFLFSFEGVREEKAWEEGEREGGQERRERVASHNVHKTPSPSSSINFKNRRTHLLH